MKSIIKSPVSLPQSPVLSKPNGKFRLSSPSESSFRRLVKHAGLRSSYDNAIDESQHREVIEAALESAGLSASFQDAMTRHGVGGYSRPEPNRFEFRTAEGGVLCIDTRTGSVWLQGGTDGQNEVKSALDSLVGRVL